MNGYKIALALNERGSTRHTLPWKERKNMLEYTRSPGLIEGVKDDETLARIRFEELDKDHWNISSTWVDPSLRGKGIASELVQMVVDEADEKNIRVVATCSYAVTWLERHDR